MWATLWVNIKNLEKKWCLTGAFDSVWDYEICKVGNIAGNFKKGQPDRALQ